METNASLQQLRDVKFYLENFTKIKGKKPGSLEPFILNEAQKDLFNTVRHNSRTIILKARQIGFCLDKETKVLSSDLKWIKLSDIQIGQEIISTEEFPLGGKGTGRKMKRAIVENKCSVFQPAFRLKMDNGKELIATAQHRFLGKVRGAKHTVWRRVEETKIGDEIRFLVEPWEEGTFEDGWFGGLMDGEGCLSKKSRTGAALTVSQIEGKVWERMLSYVNSRGYSYRIEWDKRKAGLSSKFGSKPVGKVVFSNMADIFRVIGITRPARFMDRSWWDGKALTANGNSWAKVIAIEALGEREMIDLQTSTHTYIAEGFVSHNSTAMVGYFYHDTITHPGTNTAIIGYNSELTAELLDKVKVFYRSTPASLRPTIQYNSKSEITFPQLNSKMIILPSTENVGRGYTLHNVLATELSSWEKAEDKMMTLEASVPIEGKLVIESTPKGQGNLYHRMWMTDNDYIKKEYGWWWGYTYEEIDIIRRRMNDPAKFAQEYGLEFLASGRNVFESSIIAAQRRNVWKMGETYLDNDNMEYTVHEENRLRIYKEPVAGTPYVIGVDVAEGVQGGDFSVATVWNRYTGEEVAMFRGLVPPDRFADFLNVWGRKYNNALLAVEINNHGLTTLTCLKQLLYPSLYFRPKKIDAMSVASSDKFGWKTTKVTRPLLIDEFAQACRAMELIIHSKETLDEMSVFIYNDAGNMVPQATFHDDTIFSSGIAYQAFKMVSCKPLEQLDYRKYLPASYAY